MEKPIIAAALVLLLAGCTAMPETTGPDARLLPTSFCQAPRSLDSIELTVHQVSLPEAIKRCAMMRAKYQPGMAALLFATGSITLSCAHVKRASCEVVTVEGWEGALAHELLHCQCWDHPGVKHFTDDKPNS